MYRSVGFLALFLSGVFMAGCTTIAVQRDYDNETSFEKYNTFAWLDAKNTQDLPAPYHNDDILDKRIKRAVTGQLSLQGFTAQSSSTPDFYVVYRVGMSEQIRDDYYDPYYSYGSGYGYRGYGYRGYGPHRFGGYGYGYPYGHYGSSSSYTEGTLVVDILHGRSKRLVWRGAAVTSLYDSSFDEKDILKAVEKILKDFPPLTYPAATPEDFEDVVAS